MLITHFTFFRSVIYMHKNKALGVNIFSPSILCVSHVQTRHTFWCCSLKPPDVTQWWTVRQAVLMCLCPKTILFPSAHIAARRQKGISVATRQHFTSAQPDGDLSFLNTAAISNGSQGEQDIQTLASVMMNQCPAEG